MVGCHVSVTLLVTTAGVVHSLPIPLVLFPNNLVTVRTMGYASLRSTARSICGTRLCLSVMFSLPGTRGAPLFGTHPSSDTVVRPHLRPYQRPFRDVRHKFSHFCYLQRRPLQETIQRPLRTERTRRHLFHLWDPGQRAI